MKPLLLIFIFFNVSYSGAQDTLFLHVPSLGHEKYVLYNDETFIYCSQLCGASFLSYGSYKKNIFGYKFNYDTTRCHTPSIIELKQESITDSIMLSFYNMVDSSRQGFFGEIIIGELEFSCRTDSILVSKKEIKSDTLTLRQYKKEYTFTFDITSSNLKLYIEPKGFGYNCGINDLKKLKKTRYGYLHKFNVFDEIKEKPCKRGKKRVVRHYYQWLD